MVILEKIAAKKFHKLNIRIFRYYRFEIFT